MPPCFFAGMTGSMHASTRLKPRFQKSSLAGAVECDRSADLPNPAPSPFTDQIQAPQWPPNDRGGEAKLLDPASGWRTQANRATPRSLAVVLTPFHRRVIAEKLALGCGDGTERLAPALSGAKLDLNPHQVEAAAFALDSLRRGGCLLAD